MQEFSVVEDVVNSFVHISPNTTEIPTNVIAPIIPINESVAADIVSPVQADIVEPFTTAFSEESLTDIF